MIFFCTPGLVMSGDPRSAHKAVVGLVKLLEEMLESVRSTSRGGRAYWVQSSERDGAR